MVANLQAVPSYWFPEDTRMFQHKGMWWIPSAVGRVVPCRINCVYEGLVYSAVGEEFAKKYNEELNDNS